MKKLINILLVLTILSSLAFIGCEDRSDLTGPEPVKTGDANFTSFVAIGNSLTMGVQNSATYQSAQEYSFANQIAQQIGVNFEQPLVSDPGLPNRLDIVDLEVDDNGKVANVIIQPNPQMGTPLNLTYTKPYNNLGIAGAILYDLVDETDFTAKSAARANPFFEMVLRNQAFGKSIIAQALAQNPTFITLWIGNNDVLGYATSGGTKGTDPTGKLPTEEATFKFLFETVAAAIAQSNAKVAVANIPNVSNIPFFTTVGPKVGLAISMVQQANPAVQGLVYTYGDNASIGVATPAALKNGDVLLTLLGSSFATEIGKPSGKFYRSYGIPVPAGIDTTQAFGLHPANPWPNLFTLDENEIALVEARVTSFNEVIKDITNDSPFKENWVLVDINEFFNTIKSKEVSVGGYFIDGIKFSTKMVTGNLFSLDGVHPTNQGYGVVANQFIEAINMKFNSSIPRINVSLIPGSFKLGETISLNKLNIKMKPTNFKSVF